MASLCVGLATETRREKSGRPDLMEGTWDMEGIVKVSSSSPF